MNRKLSLRFQLAHAKRINKIHDIELEIGALRHLIASGDALVYVSQNRAVVQRRSSIVNMLFTVAVLPVAMSFVSFFSRRLSE